MALRGLLHHIRIRSYASSSAEVGHSGHLSAEAAAKCAAEETVVAVTPAQRYLFDTNGYIVLKGVFTKEEVFAANEAIDAHLGASK